MIPTRYQWLLSEPGPKMLLEGLKEYGTLEVQGPKSNGTILQWAAELNLKDAYGDDSIPWCGLFIAIIAKRAGKEVVKNPLWARNWSNFGNAASIPMLGDVLVFVRDGGGHVALYVGEDYSAYHVLGGNQSDMVCITRILKTRCVSIRRPIYNNQPDNIRNIHLASTGVLSQNEA